VYHHVGVSAFADYCVVNRGSLVKIDNQLPFDEAALFGCAVLTGVGAALNTADMFPGAKVAVVGLGGVGLNALFGAKVSGASEVIGIDVHEDKLELAKQLGATAVVNAKDEEAVKKVKEITDGGVDFGFEMAGSVQAMELAYRITRRGGTTVTAGLPHPEARWPLQHVNLTAEERTVKGSYVGSCVPTRDVPRFIDLYRKGMLPVNKLMSDHISLEQINEGFDRLASGHTVRQIIMM
jgi:alcohol dehydrogenase